MNSFEYDDGKHEKRKTLRFSSFLKFLLGKELSNNFLNSIKLTFDLHLSAWVDGVFVHLSVILGLDKVQTPIVSQRPPLCVDHDL